jgi:hypothetical protein
VVAGNSRLIPVSQSVSIGIPYRDAFNGVVNLKIDRERHRLARIFGMVQNWCESPFTLAFFGSTDGGGTDPYSPVAIDVGGTVATTAAIAAGGMADVVISASVARAASGQVTLTGQPADGNTLVLDDGVAPVTFEFDSNASTTGGRVAVTIGATLAATRANLIDAINGSTLIITARAHDDQQPLQTSLITDLFRETTGTAGNTSSSKTGANITVTNMTGGSTGVALPFIRVEVTAATAVKAGGVFQFATWRDMISQVEVGARA